MLFNSTCKTCRYIRLFLFAVFLIILLALIQKDKLHYLSFVTPNNAAILIVFLGIIMFIIKVIDYYIQKNK